MIRNSLLDVYLGSRLSLEKRALRISSIVGLEGHNSVSREGSGLGVGRVAGWWSLLSHSHGPQMHPRKVGASGSFFTILVSVYIGCSLGDTRNIKPT